MNRRHFLIFVFTCLILQAQAANDLALDIYHKANIAYQKQDYQTAIQNYEQLVKLNRISPEVYYNLGNSWFKSGNISKAILNYERAKKIAPEDEDIDFNLKIASLKVADKIETVPPIFYKKWLSSLSTALPANWWSTIFILGIWLLAASAVLYILGRSSRLKKTGFLLMLSFSCLAIVLYIMAEKSYSLNFEETQGIVISASVYVKSAPDTKGNDLFILHEGTKVDILEELNDWKKIRIANGTIGWMQNKEIESI